MRWTIFRWVTLFAFTGLIMPLITANVRTALGQPIPTYEIMAVYMTAGLIDGWAFLGCIVGYRKLWHLLSEPAGAGGEG